MIKSIITLIIILFPSIIFANNFDDKFENEYKIIWCINNNFETRKPNENWNCLLWKWRQNIWLPPKSHLEIYKKVFYNSEARIINSLPTENLESWFNPNAQNKYAIWYVQTLRKRGVWLSIEEQLTRKRDRQTSQKNNKKLCWSYKTENDIIKCLYKWHYSFTKWEYYSQKSMKVREYYINYFKS